MTLRKDKTKQAQTILFYNERGSKVKKNKKKLIRVTLFRILFFFSSVPSLSQSLALKRLKKKAIKSDSLPENKRAV